MCKNTCVINQTRKCYLSYILLVTIWVLCKNICWSVVVFQWAEAAGVSETPGMFQSIWWLLKWRIRICNRILEMWKMRAAFIDLRQTALALPDLSSFPLTGWWCGSLAKKKVWQRNPCPYGGRQPLGCRHAHVRVHRHPVLHTLFASAGFLAKFQGHRYLLAVAMLLWEPLQKLEFVALLLL